MSHRCTARRPLIRQALGCSAIALAAALASPATAQSFQGSGSVTFGAATITTGAGTTTIDVASPSAVIDWIPDDSALSTGAPIAWQQAGTTATFNGTNGPFAVLNRVVPTDTTRPIVFDGNVQSQFTLGQSLFRGGTVFFYSPGGIVIGSNAIFDIGSLGLTTAPPQVDGNGNFFANNTITLGQAVSGSSVRIQPGAQINAIASGSYVALFAPYVEQNGTINANGQTALIAGEAGTFTYSPDGLFDIQVTIGSDGQNGVGISTFGTTTGSASTGAGDNRRVYLVAVPKNQMLTMAIQRGASLGFDVAGAASVEGNTVVLSAGYNVTRGAAETTHAGGSGTGTITINDGSSGLSGTGITFTSAVNANASGDLLVDVFRQTRFASDAYLRADGNALVTVHTSNDAGGFQPVPGAGSAVVPGFNSFVFPPTDDSFETSDLGFAANFFGTTYTTTFVGSNGYLTFGDGDTNYTPRGLGEDYVGLPIIAAFLADIDTRGDGDNDITYGSGTFGGRSAFGANWPGVGRFSRTTDLLNNFQILLVERGDTGVGNFDIVFNYNSIQWETSSGNGFGGNSAAVGYNAGTGNQPGTFFEFPGSRTPGSFIDGGPLALASNSNVGEAGRYVFTVRNGNVAPAVSRGLLEVGGNLTVSAVHPGSAGSVSDAGSALVNLTGGNASVAGSLRIEADASRDANGSGLVEAGSARATVTGGGTLGVSGDTLISAIGFSQSGVGVDGGMADLSLDGAGTATVGGVTRILSYGIAGLSNGFDGAGGTGTGGSSSLAVQGGSRFTTNELNIAADGVGGADAGNGGGAGLGGNATISVAGAGSALTVVSTNVTGNPDSGDFDLVSAEGFGGVTRNAGGVGGTANGGTLQIAVSDGGSLSLPTAAGVRAPILARSFGGAARGDNSTGGVGTGGTLAITVDGGTLTGAGLLPSSYGQGGGNFSGPQTLLVNGGDGVGGTRTITFTNGAGFTGSTLGGCPCGLGGQGTGGGRGGNASGGNATTLIDASTVNITSGGFATFSTNTGGNGASDGNASGSIASVTIRNGSTVNLADGTTLGADAQSVSNIVGTGTVGGDSIGGTATLTVAGSTITGNGVLNVIADGTAGSATGTIGTGRGGTAIFQTSGTSAIDVAALNVSASGSSSGAPGISGNASAVLAGTTIAADTVAIATLGTGGTTGLLLSNSTLAADTLAVTSPGSATLDLASSSVDVNSLAIDVGTFVLPATRTTAPGAITAPNFSLTIGQGGSIRTYASIVTTGNRSFSAPEIVLGGFRTNGTLSLAATAGNLDAGDINATSATLTASGAVQIGAATLTGLLSASSGAQGITIANASAGSVQTSGRTGTAIGTITAASSINVVDLGAVTVNGQWAAPSILINAADVNIGSGGSLAAGATGSVDLVSSNAGGAFIGDGLSGQGGFRLTNAEFGRISGNSIFFGAPDIQANPVDLTIGTLTIAASQLPGVERSLDFATGDAETLMPSGRIRIDGEVSGSGFANTQYLSFTTGSFELNAETGLISLTGSGPGGLGGIVEIDAANVHVASPSILARLRDDPRYQGVIQELNAPAAIQRPDGVLRAQGLLIFPSDTFYIQNTGTVVSPAGFYTTLEESDIEPPGFENPQAAAVDVIINGRFATSASDLTGSRAYSAITDNATSINGFAASSQINGCAISAGACASGSESRSLTVAASQFELLNSTRLDEQPFDVGEGDEEQEESEKAARAPIDPPVVLIDTRPLNPPIDIVDPVSGSGNPASLLPVPATGDDGDEQ